MLTIHLKIFQGSDQVVRSFFTKLYKKVFATVCV
jgi:hypothetical protein